MGAVVTLFALVVHERCAAACPNNSYGSRQDDQFCCCCTIIYFILDIVVVDACSCLTVSAFDTTICNAFTWWNDLDTVCANIDCFNNLAVCASYFCFTRDGYCLISVCFNYIASTRTLERNWLHLAIIVNGLALCADFAKVDSMFGYAPAGTPLCFVTCRINRSAEILAACFIKFIAVDKVSINQNHSIVWTRIWCIEIDCDSVVVVVNDMWRYA